MLVRRIHHAKCVVWNNGARVGKVVRNLLTHQSSVATKLMYVRTKIRRLPEMAWERGRSKRTNHKDFRNCARENEEANPATNETLTCWSFCSFFAKEHEILFFGVNECELIRERSTVMCVYRFSSLEGYDVEDWAGTRAKGRDGELQES
eukprot:scaffold36882_cov176-Amphora_coffeaeformis.AAC.1